MNVITTVAEMQAERGRMAGNVGLVPTMGYLHEGHLSLVRRAYADNDHVIVSIFVNPTQFGPSEDFERYPRDEERDLRLLEAEGVHAVFIPSVEEIYPPGFDDWVEVKGPLTERLEGAHRPGHFRGVTTVVARLFRIIRPHRAYFGQKDAQQLRVIKRMVADIHPAHPEAHEADIEIVAVPTVREPHGLAMSSRNVYLLPEQREAALALPHSLTLARRLVMKEGITDANAVRQALRAEVEAVRPVRPEEPGAGGLRGGGVSKDGTERQHAFLAFDYVSISDEQTLEELATIDRPALVLLAARVGATRLIDNTIVIPDGVPAPEDVRELSNADAASLPLTSDH